MPRSRLGDYELLFELASGGMATLYVARQVGAASVERLVAVKRVRLQGGESDGMQTMFRDEARLSAQIRHANVVRVLDVLESSGELLIVMDYIESVSLSGLRQAARAAGEALPIPVVVRVLADALAGLNAAHEATDLRGAPLAIVHRDVSPQNVLVGSDGTSHLIDFGVATAKVRATQTASGVLKGKFHYMSPEQARGAELDRRSDVFSAGVVLFEALTGALPFGDDTTEPSAVLLRIMLDPVPPASSLAHAVPPELDAVIEKALERVRDERFASAGAMREALVAAVAPAGDAEVAAAVARWCEPVLAGRRERVRRALAETETETETDPTVADRPAAPTRSPVRVAIGLALVAAMVAGVTAVVVSVVARDDERDPVVASTEPEPVQTTTAPPTIQPPSQPPAQPPPAQPPRSQPSSPAKATTTPTTTTTITPTTHTPSTAIPPGTAQLPRTFGLDDQGRLFANGHQVILHERLVSNSTSLPDDALRKELAAATPYTLSTYARSLAYVSPGAAPPAGTITVTIAFDGSRRATPQYQSAIPVGQLVSAVAGAVQYGLGRAMTDTQASVDSLHGTIVLAADITTAP